MNRGPAVGHRPKMTFAEKIGPDAPDWIAELAAEADRHGLAKAGKTIGYSASAVSTVLSGTYRGDVGRVEQMVRGALMALTVDCPVLGDLTRDRCLAEQREPFRATSRHRAQLYHACKTCANRRQP